ncbi:MAG: TetR/AcrR family transcriptional regulator [Xanthomonadaceae bacterium]|nr:TetR/AcrR family transcriptional regulator [Xanthomonadaceae bacterium]
MALSKRQPRLSASDWAQAALDVIAEQGVAAIAVEPLARRLKVTKGSFYWHFPSRDALLQAALECWETLEQERIFGGIEQMPDPRERLRTLFQIVGQEAKPHIIYGELLRVSNHPIVQPVIDRVSQRRQAFLTTAYREVGFSDIEAAYRARLTYSAYVGFLQLSFQLRQQPKLTHEEFDAYLEHVTATLIPK